MRNSVTYVTSFCFIVVVYFLWTLSQLKAREVVQNSSNSQSKTLKVRTMTTPKDNSKWMELLPVGKQNISLQSLTLPGSHDSCSFSLRKDLEISPSESKWLRALAYLFPKQVKSIVYNWSVTQTYTIYQQLHAGIRYLDFRVSKRPKDGMFRTVHGLYGATYSEIFEQVKTFLTECPKEIIVLDFNHFYDMTDEDHVTFSNSIKQAFGKTMRPPGPEGVKVTLKELWDNKQNILAFYDDTTIVKQSPCFWNSSDIYSPWADTSDLSKLLSFLENETESKLPPQALHVAQGLLTPNTKVLLSHLTGSLKTTLAVKATDAVTSWLSKANEHKGVEYSDTKVLNIVIVDFIETDNFTSTVIQRNYSQD